MFLYFNCCVFHLNFTLTKERQSAKERLLEYFENGPGRECEIDHLYFERRFVKFYHLPF